MNELITYAGLKREYYLSNFLWKYVVKRILGIITKLWQKTQPLVAYPLVIDIELGTMKLYYFKYGFSRVIGRAYHYNKVLLKKMEGEQEEELDVNDFLRENRLTKKEDIDEQLEQEMRELDYI